MTNLIPFFAAITHVIGIAKTISETRDEVKLGALKLEFNNALLDLNQKQIQIVQANHQLVTENEGLKKQIAAHNRWEVERARYELFEPVKGTFVYALKCQFVGEEPAHWLCSVCFQDGLKSILQQSSSEIVCSRILDHSLILPDSTVVGRTFGAY
jgi:hypothetical protein